MIASAPPEHYRRAEKILLADEGLDSLVVIFIPPIASNADEVAASIVEGAAGARKPVLATFMSAKGAPPVLAPHSVLPVPRIGGDRARARGRVRGMEARARGGGPDAGGRLRPAGRAPWSRRARARRRVAGPAEAQELLSAFGIPVAPMLLARTEAGAVAAAKRLGFPIALKAVGRRFSTRPRSEGCGSACRCRRGGARLSRAERSASAPA